MESSSLPVSSETFSKCFAVPLEKPTEDELEQIVPEEIWTVEKIISPEETESILRHLATIGFHDATVGVGEGKLEVRKEWRNNKRCIIDDEASAQILWSRVKHSVSKCLLEWMPVGLNPRFRFYYYEAGQYFKQHIDGCYTKNSCEISSTTFQVYLTEGTGGGETTFFDDIFPDGKWACPPTRGKGLFFHHRGWLHEGSRVTAGKKISVRSDVVYRKPGQDELSNLEKRGFHDFCNICRSDLQISIGECQHLILHCRCNFLVKPSSLETPKPVLLGRFCPECEDIKALVQEGPQRCVRGVYEYLL